jgi:hypothetical protein
MFATAASFAAVAGGPVSAQSVFTGDCGEANALMNAKSIEQYFAPSYTGITRGKGRASCYVSTMELTRRSSNSQQVVFTMSERSVHETVCLSGTMTADTDRWGTLTLTQSVRRLGSLCELIFTARYDYRQISNPAYASAFEQRAIPLSDSGDYFVVLGGGPTATADIYTAAR